MDLSKLEEAIFKSYFEEGLTIEQVALKFHIKLSDLSEFFSRVDRQHLNICECA